MTITPIRTAEPAQVDLIDDIDHEPGEVILGQPVRHIRRQQEPLTPIRRHEVVRHHQIMRSAAENREHLQNRVYATGSSVTTLRATEASHVIGKVAKVTLVGGALLVPSQIGEAPELSADQAVVGAVLKPGQYPTQLEVGSTVRVVEVPTADSTGRIEPVSHGVGRVADIAESASDSSIQVVSLVVDRTTSEAIASAGASGRLSLIVEGVS